MDGILGEFWGHSVTNTLAVFFSVLQKNQPSHTSYHLTQAFSTSAIYLYRWLTFCLFSMRIQRTPFNGAHLLVFVHDIGCELPTLTHGETSPTGSGRVPCRHSSGHRAAEGPFRASHTDWRRCYFWHRLPTFTRSSSATSRRKFHHQDTSDSTGGDTTIPMLRSGLRRTIHKGLSRRILASPLLTSDTIIYEMRFYEICHYLGIWDFTHLGGAHHL